MRGRDAANGEGLVFIGRRAGGIEHVDETHVWQMPQGGVDPGEDDWEAARRELYEETSVRSVEKLGEIGEWLTYEFRAPSQGAPGKDAIAASGKNGSRCASPARTARSMSRIPAAATRRSLSTGAGSR